MNGLLGLCTFGLTIYSSREDIGNIKHDGIRRTLRDHQGNRERRKEQIIEV